MLAVSVIFFIGAPGVMYLFCKGNTEVVHVGTLALRAYCFAAPLTALVTTISMVLQSIGKSGQSTLLSCCRQGAFLLPLLLYLPSQIGLLGVQLAQSLADTLTFFTALSIYIFFNKHLQKLEQSPM